MKCNWLYTVPLKVCLSLFRKSLSAILRSTVPNVFNATFSNISVISWRSALLVEKQEYQKKTTDLPQDTDKLCHIMLYQAGFELTMVSIGYTGSCKSNYHAITTTTALILFEYFALRIEYNIINLIMNV